MKSKKVLLILFTALFLFIALTILVVTEMTPVHNFNHSFYAPISLLISPALTTIASLIGSLTHWYSYTPIILLLLFLPATRMKAGLPLAITLSASAILGPVILKNIFAIERPNINQLVHAGGFGYPSGHSTNALVFFGMCAILILRYSTHKLLKIGFTAFAVAAILLVGLSRIYLGVHTLTDVIGGYLLGTVVICVSLLVEKHLREKSISESEGQGDDGVQI